MNQYECGCTYYTMTPSPTCPEHGKPLGQARREGLLDCPAGHLAETWLCGGWVLVGCKKCGHAVAAHKSFEQAEHDWNTLMIG